MKKCLSKEICVCLLRNQYKQSNLKAMQKLKVKTEFEITTTNAGKIFARVGDTIIVSDRGVEHYNILKVNNIQIFSIWMRKMWVNAKCN
jgi:hypothetical protein